MQIKQVNKFSLSARLSAIPFPFSMDIISVNFFTSLSGKYKNSFLKKGFNL